MLGLALVAAGNLARRWRKPASDANELRAVATASKRGSFQMWLPLCQDEAPRRFLGAMVRRQRVLHMSRTGGMRRRAASIPDTSKPLGLQPASATTTLQPCARPADYRANVAAIAIG